ncbi:MAG: hypothetical protein RR090_08270 [Niameybacter sp.]
MIKKVELADSHLVAQLALLLWPEHKIEDLEEELKGYITSK